MPPSLTRVLTSIVCPAAAAAVALFRRYNNVVMDEERKMQADIFLGLKQRLYFPTLHLPYRCAHKAAVAVTC
jgi:hypothetical protein